MRTLAVNRYRAKCTGQSQQPRRSFSDPAKSGWTRLHNLPSFNIFSILNLSIISHFITHPFPIPSCRYLHTSLFKLMQRFSVIESVVVLKKCQDRCPVCRSLNSLHHTRLLKFSFYAELISHRRITYERSLDRSSGCVTWYNCGDNRSHCHTLYSYATKIKATIYSVDLRLKSFKR